MGVACLLLGPDLSEEQTMLTMLQLFSLLVFARSLHSTWFVCVCPSWQQMEKQCVDALAKLNAVIMILEEEGGGGCSGDMANKDAFCQPPVSSEQTSAFLKHLLLVAPNKFMYNKIIYRVFFDHM